MVARASSSASGSRRSIDEPEACSAVSLDVGEPLGGTATTATAWIAIEQTGPYGRDALTQSRFPTDIGAELVTRADEISAKVVLIRDVGKHVADATTQPTRRVWVARSLADQSGAAAMVRLEVDDPAELLAINFQKLLTGNLADAVPHSTPDHEPLLLICTHAKRDVCCARKGRPVAIDLVEKHGCGDRIWEVSHLGGHRLAPTAVVLPAGYLHGRLDASSADHAWSEAQAGSLALGTCRGRSSLEPAAQVAELAVRSEYSITGIDDLLVLQDLTTPERQRDENLEIKTWIVSHRTTHDSWEVEVASEPLPDRPESCGKPAQPAKQLRAIAIRLRD